MPYILWDWSRSRMSRTVRFGPWLTATECCMRTLWGDHLELRSMHWKVLQAHIRSVRQHLGTLSPPVVVATVHDDVVRWLQLEWRMNCWSQRMALCSSMRSLLLQRRCDNLHIAQGITLGHQHPRVSDLSLFSLWMVLYLHFKSISVSICIYFSISTCISIYIFLYLSIYLPSFYLCTIHLSIYLSNLI